MKLKVPPLLHPRHTSYKHPGSPGEESMCAASASVRGHLVITGARALNRRAASMASVFMATVFPAGSDIAPCTGAGRVQR